MQKIYRIVLICAVAVIVFSLLALFRASKRFVLMVDNYEVRDTSVTIGRNSDVCFDKIPEQFLTITRTPTGFRWEVNRKYVSSDSLCYMKINGANPNLHPLSSNQSVVVNVGNRPYTLQVSELDKLLDGHESQYVLLRNALEKHRSYANDSGFGDFRQEHAIRSFFFRDKDRWGRLLAWQLVILDRHTRIEGGEEPVVYATSGVVDDCCKVQFYTMAEYSFKSDDDDLFHIDEINYMAKPVLLTTEWGAGHTMLRQSGDAISVGFPKPLTYTEDCGKLRSMAKVNTSVITLHQNDGSLPVGSNVYIPRFSSKSPMEVSHIVFSHDSLLVDGHNVRAKFSPLPRFDAFEVDKGNVVLHFHAGVIGKLFLLSYLWLPLVLFLLVFFTYPRLVSLKGIHIDTSYFASNLPNLFRMVAVLAFAYCICKSMIAIKLSWTYPYFEKLTGVSVVDGGLLLLLFFTLSLLFNHAFLTARSDDEQGRRKRWSLWLSVIVSLSGLVLCVGALLYSDHHFSRSVLDSYLPGELFCLNPWDWTKLVGANDLHRTIPYTLVLFNVVTIFLLVMAGIWPLLSVFFKKEEKASVKEPGWHARLSSQLDKKSWASALLTALGYCIVVLVVSAIPGNFSTAFITFFVVVGMSHSLLKIDYASHRVRAFFTSLGIIVMFLAAAIIWPTSDTGYFINLLGFASLIVLLYIIVEKYAHGAPSESEMEANRKERNSMNWLLGVTLFMLVVGFPQLMRLFYDPDDVDYSRKTHRFLMYSQFNDYRDSGYRYAVSDTEFMTVMVHGMFNTRGSDPLSPDKHPLHPSVSTGQSPVVLNDVAVPIAFFGTYGISAYVVYFVLLFLLLLAVTSYSIPSQRRMDDGESIESRTLWRLLSVMMWVGCSYYLYLSYVGMFPFTGRLNPGLGVDSVGEALESAVLLAFMTATRLKDKDIETVNKEDYSL